MVRTLNWTFAIVLFLAISVQSQAQNNAGQNNKAPTSSESGIVAEEVIVESSLNVRQKPSVPSSRRARNTILYVFPNEQERIVPLQRKKRQFPNFGHFNNYDNSQATAQSNSHSNHFGPNGAQSANALAGAQAFQSSGPYGGFGATANNAATNTLGIGPHGSQGSAGFSGGQTYNLPNGQTLNIAYNNGFSNGPNSGPSISKGQSIAVSG